MDRQLDKVYLKKKPLLRLQHLNGNMTLTFFDACYIEEIIGSDCFPLLHKCDKYTLQVDIFSSFSVC